MWKHADIPPTLQIATECGFLNEEEAKEISQDLEDESDGKDPVLELLVRKGVLTLVEAEVVSKMRMEKCPGDHLLELTKAKRKAIQKSSDSESRLRKVITHSEESSDI